MRFLLLAFVIGAFATQISEREDKDEDDGCGDICQFIVGIFVDQLFKHIVLPGLHFCITSSNSLLFTVGILLFVSLCVLVLYALFEKVCDYKNASASMRTSTFRKDAACALGYTVSAKFL